MDSPAFLFSFQIMKYLFVCLLASLLVVVISAKPESAPTAINPVPGKGETQIDVTNLDGGVIFYENMLD